MRGLNVLPMAMSALLAMVTATYADAIVSVASHDDKKVSQTGTRKKGKDMTPAERLQWQARREQRRAARVAAAGGYVEKANDGKPLYIVNTQTAVSETPVKETMKDIEDLIHLRSVIGSEPIGDKPWETARRIVAAGKAGVVIILLESDSLPSILVAPESQWGIVNVGALKKDKPRQEVLDSRTRKEIWRVAAYIMGAANSMFQPCLMRTIAYPRELDMLRDQVPSPEPFNKMMMSALRFGMKPIEITTYQRACEQGWAPPPTNDIQKAIWEKFHAEKERGPSHPITILPPKTKK